MTAQVPYTSARVYSIPMRSPFRNLTAREGVLLEGPLGWGEFCAFVEYDDLESVAWLEAAIEQCTTPWPAPVRDRIPVNCIIPTVEPEEARRLAAESSCRTAKIKVASHPGSLSEDMARVEAVRDGLGPGGAIRVDANCLWDVDTAVRSIKQLDVAAGGLEYVEQPCETLEELAAVRRRVDVRIAADESIRRAEDPLKVAVAGAADLAIIKPAPLGGVRRALQVAEAAKLPCVVTSTIGTSLDVAASVALAAALPELDFACGLDTLSLLNGDVVADTAALRPAGGFISVPSVQPEPSSDLLDRFVPADQARTDWWLNRLDRVLIELNRRHS